MPTAEQLIVRLEAQVDEHNRRITGAANVVDRSMSQIERSATRAEGTMRRATTSMAEGTQIAAYRARLLGYQISDIGTQLSSGTSPFLVLAQQAPHVAQALDGTAGAAGRLAAFFSGPWGAALLAAGSIAATVLIPRIFDIGDEAEKATPKVDDLRKAIQELNANPLRPNFERVSKVIRELVTLDGAIAR